MQVQDILNSLNIISEKLFKSVEGQVYTALDNIVVIGSDILTSEPLKSIFSENKVNGIIIIANSLLLFYIIYYTFTQLTSLYNGNKAQNIYSFIFRMIFVAVIVNNSYFICTQILNIFEGLTYGIDIFCKDIAHKEISFQNLKENILSIDDFMKNDLLSLDGLIKGVISFGSISILINFSIRYVTIIFLLIIAPIALSTLGSDLTGGIFKTWLHLLITNLFTQIVVKLIILIPIMYKDINSIMYKIILVGTIYILYKINMFVKDLTVKITLDAQKNNIFKN